MQKRYSGAVAALALCYSLTAQAGGQAGASWGYEGAQGPEHWGELDAAYQVCGQGKNQAPVDIVKSKVVDAKLTPIKLDYSMLVPERIRNNGHTIQVDMRSGGTLTVDGMEFELKQFHFHTASEHTIDGLSYPLEAHFVHQNEAGELAVLAMLFAPGMPDRTLQVLWDNMPREKGAEVSLGNYSLQSIESESDIVDYYRYNGSLTTPPCSEGVRWIVMKRPGTVSREQLAAFEAALTEPNNRPVQPLNARLINE